MRRIAVITIIVLITVVLTIQPAVAQTTAPSASPTPAPSATPLPSPTPSPIDACFKDGPIACIPPVARELGLWGVAGVIAVFLLIFFVFTPLGKVMQDGIEERWKSLPIFRASRPTPSEIERREAEYLQELGQSALLKSPDEMMAQLDAYLANLRDRENPLKPSEEKVYIPLEGGLDISPRIGLFRGGQEDEHHFFGKWLKARFLKRGQPVESSKMFSEQKIFATIEEAMNAVDEDTQAPYPVLVLLGEPGAGKSTLLRKFMRDQVRTQLSDSPARLPLFVSLGAHKNGTPLTFLRSEWKRMLGYDGLDEALADGCLWLFADGLNEMPRAGYDTRMAQWRAFLRECFSPNGNRALITCRTADYGEGIGAPRLIIHKMDEDHIVDFLQKRVPDRAEVLWRELVQDRDNGNGKIYELAQVPFWLVMLTRLSGKSGLPRNRAGLLDSFINTWLDYENTRPAGHVLNDIQRQAFMDSLTDLAWEGLSRSQNYTFQRRDACKILFAGQKVVTSSDLLDLGQDCNLIAVEGENLRFQHQLLQEFFAARKLARLFVNGNNMRGKWRISWRRWKFVRSRWDPLPDPPQTGWEEAVILAAGMLNPIQAEKLALDVLKDTPPLAARCMIESGTPIGADTQKKAKERLLGDLQNRGLRLPTRLAAGKTLARMGDPRLFGRLHESKDEAGKMIQWIEPDWIEVPAGTFTMGTTALQARYLRIFHRAQANRDEFPAHPVFISAFQMARYPVTVAEYRCFMEAGGYENDTYWQDPNALRWRNAPLPFEESYAAFQMKLLRGNEAAILAQLDQLVKQGNYSPAQANSIRQQLKMQDNAIRRQWEGYEAQKRNVQGAWSARGDGQTMT